MANTFRVKNLISKTGIFSDQIVAPNLLVNSAVISAEIDIYSGLNPKNIRIFNKTGLNTGEFAFLGWKQNELFIGTEQSQSGILRNFILTGSNININPSGNLSFAVRPTLNGTGFLLIGEVAALPSDILYTTGNQTINGAKNFISRPTVNSSGVILIGETLPSTVASGAGGAVFITDISENGAGNVGDKVYENISDGVGNTALVSCSTTTQNVLVDIYALQGRSRFKPKIYITGSEIAMTRQTDAPVFKATNVAINLNNATSLRVDHEEGSFHTVLITQEVPPQVSSAYFYGGYPTSPVQTELKATDTFNFHVDSDVPIVQIEIANFGAFNYNVYNVSAGTSHNLVNIPIANRGDAVQNLGARVRVKKANNSWSNYYTTSDYGSTDGYHTVKLNNIKPSITINTPIYPGGRGAIKSTESATVPNTVLYFDTISYTNNLTNQITINNSSVYENNKVVTYNAGNYNDSSANFKIEATRNANNSSHSLTTVVKIANIAPTLEVETPQARLRSGGNNNTSPQNHTITIKSNQELSSAPTLVAPIGIWQGGGFIGGPKNWTRSLQINDNMIKGTYSWGAISATNIAGLTSNTITTGPSYVLGGFVSRALPITAFLNTGILNTEVVTYSKMSLSKWQYPFSPFNTVASLPNKKSVGDTQIDQDGAWSINSLNVNPTTVLILDTQKSQSISQDTEIIVEEVV